MAMVLVSSLSDMHSSASQLAVAQFNEAAAVNEAAALNLSLNCAKLAAVPAARLMLLLPAARRSMAWPRVRFLE
jgi:hypothetical protein